MVKIELPPPRTAHDGHGFEAGEPKHRNHHYGLLPFGPALDESSFDRRFVPAEDHDQRRADAALLRTAVRSTITVTIPHHPQTEWGSSIMIHWQSASATSIRMLQVKPAPRRPGTPRDAGRPTGPTDFLARSGGRNLLRGPRLPEDAATLSSMPETQVVGRQPSGARARLQVKVSRRVRRLQHLIHYA